MSLDASELAPIEETPQPAEETAQPDGAIQTVEAQPAEDEPEAVEIKPGEKYVPLSALKETREALKELKPLAQKAQQLEAELNQLRPYAEFVRANPQLLQPQQPQPVAPPPDPATDPQVIAYAKRFDLYTADGRPDVERAKAIIDDNRRVAREEAAAAIAPIEQQSNEQRAVNNLNNVLALKDGDGRALDPQFITAAVQSLAQGTDQRELIKMLADPKVANVVAHVALGLQAKAPRKATVAAPATAPLHTETAGGRGPDYTMSAGDKRIAQIAKVSEKDWTASQKNFNPNGPNTFD